jgi:hypothetical protein
MMRVPLSLLAFACLIASAAEPVAKKYTPEIHGMLTQGKLPVGTNVCLRQGGTEIRSCGYTDSAGHFFISSSGPLHSAQTKSDGSFADVIPPFWLETGRVDAAKKLWPIDPVSDRFAAIELDCDLSHAGRPGDVYRSCEMKATKPLVMNVPRDDTPYRMARNQKAPAK